ncbi:MULTISPECIES: hypothetical protein [Photorhabdus]|uniref:Uncharacterized protein n=2 Tax=Photorhabdus asymbiotica TaxID=291112 RepID=C7BJL4_PHOAA|nr:hypothetical protein [Photorhabdus asymbiotica]RKS59400.1 hypothetical protein BDD30_1471 [Photorhabdus asymbiotica]CAQ85539.1 conserved hypothetical protein [Photorhabdus asymbiotica]
MDSILFIEIESSYKAIPLLVFKRDRHSSIIKKSQVRIYSDAHALLMAIEEQVQEFQKLIEQQTVQMIEDKERELNEHISHLQASAIHQLTLSQQQWLEKAEEQLNKLLDTQEKRLSEAIADARNSMASTIRNRLIEMNQSDSLIGYLSDALHAELNDVEKSLVIVKSYSDNGITLTIENDDCMVSINTQELLSELKSCLENMSYD